MDVEVITLTKEAVSKWKYRNSLEIRINGKKAVRFFDGDRKMQHLAGISTIVTRFQTS